MHAVIDDEDWPLVRPHRWYAWSPNKGKTWYAVTNKSIRNGAKRGRIYMHRLIVNVAPNELVDHRNHNGLDNRRNNTRQCTKQQNQSNMSVPRVTKSSRFKGVSWKPECTRWRAYISLNNRYTHLGHFDTEVAAAKAYDKAAKKHFGEFACLNFPEQDGVNAINTE